MLPPLGIERNVDLLYLFPAIFYGKPDTIIECFLAWKPFNFVIVSGDSYDPQSIS